MLVAAGVLVVPQLFPPLTAEHEEHAEHHRHVVATAAAMVPAATAVPRTGWVATASGEEVAGEDGRAANALDGDPSTIWHSPWTTPTPLPQSITVDTRQTQRLSGLVYTPRPGGGNGTIGRYEIHLSTDGTTWGAPVATGTAADDASAKTFSFAVAPTRYVRLTAITEAGGRGQWASAAEIGLLGDPGAPAPAVRLPRTGWTATASDQQATDPASNAVDGDPATMWHSRYSSPTPLPHWITLDLGRATAVSGLLYRPRPSGVNGRVGEYRVSVSDDGTAFADTVSSGAWPDGGEVRHALFTRPVTTRYVRLTALTEAGARGPWTSVAEIDLLGPPPGARSPLSRVGWTASASTQDPAHTAAALLDGDTGTHWRTGGTTAPPHTVTVDLSREQEVSAIVVTPRADSADGRVGAYSVAVSADGTTWGAPVATGTWDDDGTPKTAVLTGNPRARHVRVTVTSEAGGRGPWATAAEFHAYGPAAPSGPIGPLDRFGWVATASDEEATGEDGRAANVLDGVGNTLWHSKWTAPEAPLPHWITLDTRQARTVTGISVRTRPADETNGRIGRYRVQVSADGTTWSTPVAEGTWPDAAGVHRADFGAPVETRYVRLTALTEAGGRGPWTSAAEIDLLGPTTPPDPSAVGAWGPLTGFPIVPVASALLPNNKLLTWSAYAADNFGGANGYTQTAILDLATGQVTQRRVDNTGHDMFCPGTSVLPDGRVLVTGGSDAGETSIYDPVADTWVDAADMAIPRGYQGQTTLSTGEAFTVGGSWSGGEGNKTAEVYSPATNAWRTLSGVRPAPFLTADPQGVYRADNHTWLFAVGGGRVFHAGPSRRMNWISTTGAGSVTDAGVRGDSADAMNGNAVMYDVGKILTVGGATAYQDADATTRAHRIDITSGTPVVTRVPDMAHARAFANSVVLPNGQVVVIGGQSRPVPFSDHTATLVPELWDPTTGAFTRLAPMAVPRTYHSVANLLPDGRVFSGGGGLCGGCATNHPDGQVLTPPYLLNPDGSPRVRPSITTSPTRVLHGAPAVVGTDRPVTGFALMRTSSVTHSVDNDQRRVPLVPQLVGPNSYRVTVPADPGIALPGSYLLFALDANGVPSVGKPVRVG
ncbi:discoidin domain-containing protein [Saccharothrix sp. Mg75]|uniref:discoidin domain-containing protein n=1 Tax=Saccharothrix sp. Mg75 TaxID=3445357 RepID=UPI003EF0058C